MTRAGAALLAALAGGGLPAITGHANPVVIPGDLYTGHAIVTGTDGRDRPAGFARALREVLVKLTAEPALADDPALEPDAQAAESLAEDFVYQDRMSDVRTHDEQGTRDRPFDLTVHFAPDRVAAILRRIGVAAWTDPRPPLVLLVSIARDGDHVALTADGLASERPREAAEAAALRHGMRVVLAPEAAVAASSSLQAAALPPVPGAVALRGTLTWSARDFGWVGAWRLDWQGREHAWGIAGVSFDEAFRDAVRGAARILSGRDS